MFESVASFFHFLNVARYKIQCWRRWRQVWLRSDNEQSSIHHICCWGKSIPHVHLKSLRYRLQSSEWISIRTQATLRVCLWFPRWFGDTPRCTQRSLRRSDVNPNISQSLPSYSCISHQRSQYLLHLLSEIPVTLKACRNSLLGSDTLLKLTLLSLHSTSSQIVLESSRD